MLGYVYDLLTKKVTHQIMFDVSEHQAKQHFMKEFDQSKLGYCLYDEAYHLNVMNLEHNAPITVLRDPVKEAKDDANTDHWSMHDPYLNSYGAI